MMTENDPKKRVKVKDIALLSTSNTGATTKKFKDEKGWWLNQWTMEEKEEILRPFTEDLKVCETQFTPDMILVWRNTIPPSSSKGKCGCNKDLTLQKN